MLKDEPEKHNYGAPMWRWHALGLTQGVLMPSIEAIQEMYGVSDADLIWHRSGIRKADYDEGASVGAAVLGFFRGMGERLGDMNEIREKHDQASNTFFSHEQARCHRRSGASHRD